MLFVLLITLSSRSLNVERRERRERREQQLMSWLVTRLLIHHRALSRYLATTIRADYMLYVIIYRRDTSTNERIYSQILKLKLEFELELVEIRCKYLHLRETIIPIP